MEFRGKGGIVIIPPSRHKSGRRYAWAQGRSLDDLPLPILPEQIMDALQPFTAPPLPSPGRLVDVTVHDASPSTRKFLSGAFANGPHWNDRLFKAACDLAGRGVPVEEPEPLLLEGAQPWNAGEAEVARRTIQSAYAAPRVPSRR